ncbi:unnamed protein product [Clonostachys chloroleuca]|uniref:AB hydrolase-1 domain-containing protein n=1 Tax=Clonostachys chloroleuca TaxID=1926264 RepID=A0AA35LU23_9HYPO|nr:unnamed protein product [Clonostachys chloroleuca]
MDCSKVLQASGEDLRVNWDTFWKIFRHGSVKANGIYLHYVEGGNGPVTAWLFVDPRGVGDSEHPARGYDLKTLATDLHCLVEALGLLAKGPIDVAGHGIGTWLGYAYAADWPQDVRRLTVMNASVPGVSASRTDLDPLEVNLQGWHFGFNRLDDLPELLLSGRERQFITWLFRAKAMRPWTILPEDVDEYARQFSAPGTIRALSDYYRTIFSPEGVVANRARAQKQLSIPILALGAERGYGGALVEAMRQVASNVSGGEISGIGHYMLEEGPKQVGDEMIRFFDPSS